MTTEMFDFSYVEKHDMPHSHCVPNAGWTAYYEGSAIHDKPLSISRSLMFLTQHIVNLTDYRDDMLTGWNLWHTDDNTPPEQQGWFLDVVSNHRPHQDWDTYLFCPDNA